LALNVNMCLICLLPVLMITEQITSSLSIES
jgi:hypothetical protein